MTRSALARGSRSGSARCEVSEIWSEVRLVQRKCGIIWIFDSEIWIGEVWTGEKVCVIKGLCVGKNLPRYDSFRVSHHVGSDSLYAQSEKICVLKCARGLTQILNPLSFLYINRSDARPVSIRSCSIRSMFDPWLGKRTNTVNRLHFPTFSSPSSFDPWRKNEPTR